MFLATVNQPRQLLYLTYIQHVTLQELERGRKDILALLDGVTTGFRVVADLNWLDRMDVECAAEIGRIMEFCEQRGVGQVVRIIPDPGKDIGLSILSLFHYRHNPHIVTCRSLAEAGKVLAL